MRLHKFEIRNLKGIGEASFEWDDMIVLIGENNVGKSTVLQALDFFLSGKPIRDSALFRDNLTDSDNAIELIGHFDRLTDEEKEYPAVRGRMNGEGWVIKKRYWAEAQEGDRDGGEWKEQYYSFSPGEDVFANWPEPDNAWSNFPAEYQNLIAMIEDRGVRPNDQTRDSLRQLVREHKPELITPAPVQWVQNPGGGGNWKSNANSIIPRLIFVKAVHDAADEANPKEASAYGKIINLIIERKIMKRPEILKLKEQINTVMKLFQPDPLHPELQAEEIKHVQDTINTRLNEVISGTVKIRTSEPDVRPMILPNTTLVVKDYNCNVETIVPHQGHGLQRVLIMTLLQTLAEIESSGEELLRPVVLAVEEPELYMHPQMERKMRDALRKLALQEGFQVICTTHSPVFLDIAARHRAIVRVVKDDCGKVLFFQVTSDLFEGTDADADRDRLRLFACFHPTVNEVFFSKRVVLIEELTAVSAFVRAAELAGIFARHPRLQYDVTLIDCNGKGNIPMFQRVLNHFQIPYTVIHDEDRDNFMVSLNPTIETLLHTSHGENQRHMISPTNFEQMLGYEPTGKDKPYRALKKVEEMSAAGSLPADFVRAMNWVYFGRDVEP